MAKSKKLDVNDILFRCSSVGHLISKSGKMTDGVKTHLKDVYGSWRYDRRDLAFSKYMKKGNACEEDSITLLSVVEKIYLTKNTQKLSNEFVKGETDIFVGKEITKATETYDTKTCWSLNTYIKNKHSDLKNEYFWQGVGYMWLTGAKKHTVAFCLVNSQVTDIDDEKRRLMYQPDMQDKDGNQSEKCIEYCQQIERNHIFDMALFQKRYPGYGFDSDMSDWHYDIPMAERLHCVTFERNEMEIADLKYAIQVGRIWIKDNLL